MRKVTHAALKSLPSGSNMWAISRPVSADFLLSWRQVLLFLVLHKSDNFRLCSRHYECEGVEILSCLPFSDAHFILF